MKIGICGLGLIGGSLAKAAKRCNHYVYGYDTSCDTLNKAMSCGAIDAPLSGDAISECEIVLIALYPEAAVEFVRDNAQKFRGTVVDCCGVKLPVCKPCFDIARQHGFSFVGGHPMAGREVSGFDASRETLFDGRTMILVPDEIAPPSLVSDFFIQLGFGYINITTAEQHDRAIAYTSQLAHILSSSYMQNNTISNIRGFAADSFADLTRVARMNTAMWSELFMQNSDILSGEIDLLAETLKQYSASIKNRDYDALCALIEKGTRMKEALL